MVRLTLRMALCPASVKIVLLPPRIGTVPPAAPTAVRGPAFPRPAVVWPHALLSGLLSGHRRVILPEAIRIPPVRRIPFSVRIEVPAARVAQRILLHESH